MACEVGSRFAEYLFLRHRDIYFAGRVHEHVEPSIRALGLELPRGNFVIHHFGHLCSPAELRAKNEFYRNLGRLKVNEMPNDPDAWIELGLQEYEQFRNYSAGIECLKRALTLNPACPAVPTLSLATLYVEIQADELALELLSRVAFAGRAGAEKQNICGDALYNLGRLKEARAAYMCALRVLVEDARVVSKLGLTEVRLGLKKSGLARLTKTLHENSELFEMHDRLIKGYLMANMMAEAADAAESLAIALPDPATISRAASIRAQMEDWKAPERIVLRGLELFSQDHLLLRTRAELEHEIRRGSEPIRRAAPFTIAGHQGP